MKTKPALSFNDFSNNEQIQNIINAKNCKGAIVIFQGNGIENFNGTYVISEGFITDLEPIAAGLTSYFMKIDPGVLCFLPQMLFDEFIKMFKNTFIHLAESESEEQKTKMLNFLKEKESYFNEFREQIEDVVLRFSGSINFYRHIAEWTKFQLESINSLSDDDPMKINAKELIEDTYSYSIYKNLEESKENNKNE